MKQILKQFEEQGFRIGNAGGGGSTNKLIVIWNEMRVVHLSFDAQELNCWTSGRPATKCVDGLMLDQHRHLIGFGPDEFRVWMHVCGEIVKQCEELNLMCEQARDLFDICQQEIPLVLMQRTKRFDWLKL